jgi:tight adherence protein B
MDPTLLIGGLALINVVGLAVMKMRKPAAATADGISVDAMQSAMAARKHERFGMLERIMRRQKGASVIERNLVTAGLMIKPTEFMAANIVFFIVAMFGFLMYMNTVPPPQGFFAVLKQLGAMVAIVWLAWKTPQMILQYMANKRRMTLEVQLADALAMISSGLKGGYSFVQGLGMAGEQMPAPISDEFRRVIRLIQLGVDTPRALEQMGERVNSYDYDMTISATNIQLASGGNLVAIAGAHRRNDSRPHPFAPRHWCVDRAGSHQRRHPDRVADWHCHHVAHHQPGIYGLSHAHRPGLEPAVHGRSSAGHRFVLD